MFGLSGLSTQLIGAAVAVFLVFDCGFYAGYRWDLGTIATLRADNGALKANQTSLTNGLDQCNKSITSLRAKGDAATAKAQAAIDALQGKIQGLQDARSRLASVAASQAKCPSVDAIFKGAFQ